ncbi:MAG: PH domain-containing protein [Anaerolineae bacterium]
MRDSYLENLLGEREKILLLTRQHWLVLIRDILVEIILGLAVLVLVTLIWVLWAPSPLIALGYLLLIIPVVSMLRDITRWTSHKYLVTNRRVMQIFGLMSKNVTDSSLEKVNDVKMEQSFLGRLFNYGDIEILTASEFGVNRLTRIGNPVRFKKAMLNAKEQLNRGEYDDGEEDVPALIRQLAKLRDEGILTGAEFEAKKAELLSEV